MQRDFAAASQRHPEWRAHHRFRRILQRHIELLEVVDVVGAVLTLPLTGFLSPLVAAGWSVLRTVGKV